MSRNQTLIGIGAVLLIIIGVAAYLYGGGVSYNGGSSSTTATAPSAPTQQTPGGTSGTGTTK